MRVVQDADPLTVACPRITGNGRGCGVKAGEPCLDAEGQPFGVDIYHRVRYEEAVKEARA